MWVRILWVLCLLMTLKIADTAAATTFSYASEKSRFEQRKLYSELIYLIKTRQRSRYLAQESKLKSYPLYPYLAYTDHIYRISEVSEASINAFRDQYRDTPLASQLLKNWLYSLAQRGEWKTFLANYSDAGKTDENACYHAYALYKNDKITEAITLAGDLWLVDYSQPDACDSIFRVWRDAGNLTSDLAWQRFTTAINSGESKLASYLVRFLSKNDKVLANNFKLVHRRPKNVAQMNRFARTDEKTRSVILHGIRRLSRNDPLRALEVLEKYQLSHEFSPSNLKVTYHYLAIRLAKDPDAKHALDRIPIDLTENQALIEAQLLGALKRLDWSYALIYLNLLDEEAKQTNRWQYWKARLLMSSNDTMDRHLALQTYQYLAELRSYYGFMAADFLNRGYNFEDEPVTVSGDEVLALEATPGIQRALELFAINERTRARREWRFTTLGFSPRELQIAALVAQKWGWWKQAIQAMIVARAWDDLDIRFPLAFHDSFIEGARTADIPVDWSLAIARQESSFMPDAHSSSGAVGIMQLMPATARATARAEGLPAPSRLELINPYTNIRIGTAYLGQMLRRFGQNRILASAAYNAGPSRVEKWIDERLPLDVWVETIPFKETRSYVINVLIFSAIYNRRLNLQSPLFSEQDLRFFATRLQPLKPGNSQARNTKSTIL